ncbi:MAG: ATP-binding protein [Phycisphaerae bacterium]|nr:ATP-binding protein [Phycisphaerae bacterium]
MEAVIKKNKVSEISQLLETSKRLNQTLRPERDWLVNILDSMQDGVYIIDQEHTIQYANLAIQKEFGQIDGKKCFETFFGSVKPCPWCRYEEVFQGKVIRLEFHSPKSDKVYDCIDAPIANEDGSISKLKIMRDITERQKMEESLFKLTGELENRVKERTEQLHRTVEQLQEEVLDRIMAQEKIHEHRRQLQEMATELLHVEERERRQIAVQLHDSIGQLLAFSRREIGRIKKMVPDDQQESLGYVWTLIGDAVEQTRNLTIELSSPTLYTLGFEPAIEELVEQFAERGGFEYTVKCFDEEILLPEHMQVLLYRSVRELLINIAKHAEATEVNVSLRQGNGNIEIEISDNGTGFEADMLHKDGKLSGFGLFSLRERLSTVNGEMKITSRMGAGTKIQLFAPLMTKGDS